MAQEVELDSNTNEFLAATNPTNSLSSLRIAATVLTGNDMKVTWNTARRQNQHCAGLARHWQRQLHE